MIRADKNEPAGVVRVGGGSFTAYVEMAAQAGGLIVCGVKRGPIPHMTEVAISLSRLDTDREVV